jgi:hypothetical protein
MSEKIKLVQGDSRPALVVTLTDDQTGTPIGLNGATVRLKMRAIGETTVLSTITGSVPGSPIGMVVFHWASAPNSLNVEPGDYEGEIEITFQDGQIQTVYDLLKFKIREDF